MKRSNPTNLIRRLSAVTALAVLLGACASVPLAPTASMTAAEKAIASAEQSDARQYAGAELDEARQHLVKAERSIEAERMIEADRFAKQSRVVAELAQARTEAAKAAEINREMGRGAEALIEEMQRTGDQR